MKWIWFCVVLAFRILHTTLRAWPFICPSHRSKLGIGWSRGSTIKCRVPQSMSGQGRGKTTRWPKAERGIWKRESAFILKETGVFIQVGSGMCKVWLHYSLYIIELLSDGILHMTGVCINCKKKMSANEDKSEIARTADVASELSKMQLVCTWCEVLHEIIHICTAVEGESEEWSSQ